MAIDYSDAEASALIPEVWEKRAQDAFLAGLVATKPDVITLAMTDKNQGDIVHVATMPNLSASNITATTGAITISDSTITDTTITLNQWRGVAVTVTDQVEQVAFTEVASKYAEQFGDVLGGDIDTAALQNRTGVTNTVGDTSNPERISLDILLAAALLLDDANVPQANRHWVFAPIGKIHVLTDASFTEVQRTGLTKGAVVTGELPLILGYGALVTSSVPTVGTPSTRVNWLIHRDCLGVALHHKFKLERLAKGVAASAPALATTVVGSTLYGTALIRAAAGVRIFSRTTV